MRDTPEHHHNAADLTVQDIRRKTRKRYSSEDKDQSCKRRLCIRNMRNTSCRNTRREISSSINTPRMKMPCPMGCSFTTKFIIESLDVIQPTPKTLSAMPRKGRCSRLSVRVGVVIFFEQAFEGWITQDINMAPSHIR